MLIKRNILIVFIILFYLLPINSYARSSRLLPYSLNQIWSSALRMIRIDLGCSLLERDREGGFLLFNYTQGVQTSSAAVELFEVEENNQKQIRVSITLSNHPSYIEIYLLDALQSRLRQDYGFNFNRNITKNQQPEAHNQDQNNSNSEENEDGPSENNNNNRSNDQELNETSQD